MSFTPPERKFVDPNGMMTDQAEVWGQQVTNLQVIVGTGSPETVVEAAIGRLYMDDAGTAGSILYIKKLGDISGDKTQGWILV